VQAKDMSCSLVTATCQIGMIPRPHQARHVDSLDAPAKFLQESGCVATKDAKDGTLDAAGGELFAVFGECELAQGCRVGFHELYVYAYILLLMMFLLLLLLL
jgi:hypothetical protein